MGFVAQFYCHPDRLCLRGVLCVQLYRGTKDFEACPVAVAIESAAPENVDNAGTLLPGLLPHDVEWEPKDDPEVFEDWQTDLADSKVGGVCYFFDALGDGERLLLQLTQHPASLNFGGYTALVVEKSDGTIDTRLG